MEDKQKNDVILDRLIKEYMKITDEYGYKTAKASFFRMLLF